MEPISDVAIRERAYQIWEREGRPHGRDFEHWVRAQVELIAEGSTTSSVKKAAAPTRPRPTNGKGIAASSKSVTAKSSRSSASRAGRVRKPA